MSEMTNRQSTSQWRNFAGWALAAAVFYFFAVWGVSSLLHEAGAGAMFRSTESVAISFAAVAFASLLAGFSSRKRPFSGTRFRNFTLLGLASIVPFALILIGLGGLGKEGLLAMTGAPGGVTATFVGLVLLCIATTGIVVLAFARAGTDLVGNEVTAEDMRERSRLNLYGLLSLVVSGALLIVLGLAGVLLPPSVALVLAVGLFGLNSVLWGAIWRVSDELMRTLTFEAGHVGFYLTTLLGGGWAMLAHLGFVPAPAPLDWVTLLTVVSFAAGIIATARRKLLGL